MVLDHFTEKSFTEIFWPKGHSTETPFDWMPFDRKFIRPNCRLTEGHLTEGSFYRRVIYRKVLWPIFIRKWSFDRIYFRHKKIAHKVVWPKAFSENYVSERSFDRKFNSTKLLKLFFANDFWKKLLDIHSNFFFSFFSNEFRFYFTVSTSSNFGSFFKRTSLILK
jgi:hypothetical protein